LWYLENIHLTVPVKVQYFSCEAIVLVHFISDAAGQSHDGAGGHARDDRQNKGRPLILPEKFSGEEDFSEWSTYFNSVSIVNGWSDDNKYKWLNVHVTRKSSYDSD